MNASFVCGFADIMKKHEWSPESRNKALGLIAGGRHSLRDITNITNIPKETLGDLKKRGTGVTKQRGGRLKKFDTRDKCRIELHIRRDSKTRRLSLHQLIKDLLLDALEKTVRLTLQELGYSHKIAKRRPFLKNHDRKRRLQYAKKHLHWTVEDWKSVIFTDEMSIKIGMARHSRDMV